VQHGDQPQRLLGRAYGDKIQIAIVGEPREALVLALIARGVPDIADALASVFASRRPPCRRSS
jgi:hypothetical protein